MRIAGWQDRLAAVIAASRRAVRYGDNDCAIFAARCVEAVTGRDVLPSFGAYDARGAVRLIRRYGSLSAMADAVLGPRVPQAWLREGDVAVCRVGRREAFVVMAGGRFVGLRGVAVDPSFVMHGWRVA